MKVFLGWSGPTSHKVALAFHGWLPKVIQAIKPYISSEDIAKGARWSADIAKELESSNVGIISLTRENVDSTWINFEAGALSREIDKSFVIPFLFGLRGAEIQGPLAQFQHTIYTEEEILKLMSTINSRQGESQLTKEALKAAFDVWWPRLKDELDKLAKEAASSSPARPKVPPDEMLAELLETTRTMQRDMGALSSRHETDRDMFEIKTEVAIVGEKLDTLTHRILETSLGDPSQLSRLTSLKSLLGAPVTSADLDQAEKAKQIAQIKAEREKKGGLPSKPRPAKGYGSGPVSEET